MTGERFVVGNVSGFSGLGGNTSGWSTAWTVHDRADCSRVVATFKAGGSYHGHKGAVPAAGVEALARETAAKLNAEYAQELAA